MVIKNTVKGIQKRKNRALSPGIICAVIFRPALQ